jgi:hypothetical protein
VHTSSSCDHRNFHFQGAGLEALQSNGQARCATVWTKGTVVYYCQICRANDSRFANYPPSTPFSALLLLSVYF